MHLHRRQRAAIVGADQQGCSQLIADVRRVGQLSQVAFPVGELVCTSHEPARQIATSTPGHDRDRPRGAVLSIRACQHVRYSEPPCRLGCGKRLAGARKACHASRQFGCGSQVRLHHDQVPFLKPRSSGGKAIPWIASSRSGSRLRFSTMTSGSVSPSLRSMSIRGGCGFLARRGAADDTGATTPSARVLISPLPSLCRDLACGLSMVTLKLTREPPP